MLIVLILILSCIRGEFDEMKKFLLCQNRPTEKTIQPEIRGMDVEEEQFNFPQLNTNQNVQSEQMVNNPIEKVNTENIEAKVKI